MNKIDTTRIKSDFAANLAAKRSWFDRVSARLAGTSTELTDLNLLGENYLTSVYVDFECLVSDLFHGYINNESKTYMSYVEGQIRNSVSEKYSPWHSNHLAFTPPKHIDAPTLRKLLDPTNWNITFKDVATMQRRANEWLANQHTKRFAALTPSDVALVDAAHALRNCIAHNSESSRKVMNAKIKAVAVSPTCPNRPLTIAGNSVNTVGKYLRANTPTGTRVTVYSDRLAAIGASL
jgi:hypothetical protein